MPLNFTLSDIALLIGSISILFLGIYFLLRQKRIIKNGLETEGKVVDIFRDIGNSSNTSYPIVSFKTADQILITKTSTIGLFPGSFKKGQKVKIIYEKDNPESFIINRPVMFAVPWLMIFISAGLFGFAVFITSHKSK